jgi:Berberine and berberine like
MNLNFGWSRAADDAVVFNATNTFIARSVALARSKGLDNRFIYMNYATLDEDVFGGYGPENEARLVQVRDKYDPDGVFARLQPGYFKLPSD